jgi:DnaJ-class molecular chaperone
MDWDNLEISQQSDLTPLPPDCCPDCGGEGWVFAGFNEGGDPEQLPCRRCQGTGKIDPKAP